MSLLDMFDKLDDIVYKPVEAICNWLDEPLKVREHNRQQQVAQNAAEIAANAKKQEVELALWDAQKRAELQQTQAKADIELNNMAADSQLMRNTAMVEAIKRYKLDLAQVTQEIITNIGSMNLTLRDKASEMLLSKMRDYKALQAEAIDAQNKRLLEIEEHFSNNERVRIRLEDMVMDQTQSIIDRADDFMKELNEDLRKINDTIQQLTEKSIENVNRIVGTMPVPAVVAQHLNSSNNQLPSNCDYDTTTSLPSS